MSETGDYLLFLARELGELLRKRSWVLVTAESCTAGGVAFALTQVPGSSGWFERGWVVYSNEAKQELLGVPEMVLRHHGAVSETAARAMVLGALRQCAKANVALAVTGIAGPDGGTPDKPVGTVCFAWSMRASADERPWVGTRTRHFEGDRAAVRTQSIAESLQGCCDFLRRQSAAPGEGLAYAGRGPF